METEKNIKQYDLRCANTDMCRDETQTHERLKTTLFIMTKHDLQIFGVSSLFKLQNNS